jgi:hypothetical protein
MHRLAIVCLLVNLSFFSTAKAFAKEKKATVEASAAEPRAEEVNEEVEEEPKKGLTPNEIQSVIRSNLNQIRKCYETELENYPKLAGKIVVNFVINAKNGKTKSVKIDQKTSSIKQKTMRKCIKSTIMAWGWPVPRGGEDVTVNYPFVFDPL